jgi:hypothetical protein
MEKKESKLANLLPKVSSFLPIGLGINTAEYNKENMFKRYDKEGLKIEDYDRKSIKRTSITEGICWELIRDLPAASFLILGDLTFGLAYYTGASYLIDRVIDAGIGR